MARRKTILQHQFPYHITSRCINKEWFSLPMDKVWQVFTDELYMTHIIHGLQIHCFVLMNNHYHLIASTPNSNISECMRRLQTNVSFRLTRLGNRINQTFAGRYFNTILHQPDYYLNAYKYCYRNPVAANLCEFVEDYPYSTLYGLLGADRLRVPILYDDTLFDGNTEGALRWLNTKPPLDKIEAVRWGLKRSYFKPTKNRSGKYNLKESELL